jgi:hypothetical protein
MRLGGACYPEWGILLALRTSCGQRAPSSLLRRSVLWQARNILLADLSASGRNVRCGADFGACCRSERGGGQDG